MRVLHANSLTERGGLPVVVSARDLSARRLVLRDAVVPDGSAPARRSPCPELPAPARTGVAMRNRRTCWDGFRERSCACTRVRLSGGEGVRRGAGVVGGLIFRATLYLLVWWVLPFRSAAVAAVFRLGVLTGLVCSRLRFSFGTSASFHYPVISRIEPGCINPVPLLY